MSRRISRTSLPVSPVASARSAKTSIRWRTVGYGDDGIEHWGEPIAQFLQPFQKILHDCDFTGVPFPSRKLEAHLKQRGIAVRLRPRLESESPTELLEDLLGENLKITGDPWGGELPGLSGVSTTAKLRLGRFTEVKMRLEFAEKFLSRWSREIELRKKVDERHRKNNADKMQSAKADRKVPEASQQQEQAKHKKWHDEFVGQIANAVESRLLFCRDRFLVHQGNVFFIDRKWWHSRGDTLAVAYSVIKAGIPVVWCQTTEARRGWMASDIVAWADRTLKLQITNPTFDVHRLEAARFALARQNPQLGKLR
jgi:hypothetical protein